MKAKRLFIIVIAFVILISGCSGPKPPEDEEDEEEPIEEIEEIEEPPGFVCTLTGLKDTEEANVKQRPIAVMIDNEINARPQSGLDSAEIIYEIPVEGNITRYMGIYHHLPSEKIGPVRSARPYFIDKALEFGAIYVHCGGSPQALKDLSTLNVDAFNDLKGTPVFWRSTDRKMPHNLYTNTKYMREVSETKKLENKSAPEYFKFSDDFSMPDGAYQKKVLINYSGYYKVSYLYNEEEKVYYRFINDTPMQDKETKNDIKAINIIIEKVGIKVIDNVGRLQLSNIGKNRGYFLTGGRLIEIEWQKDSRGGKTVYRDLKGNEIELNKGITWIQVVSVNTKIDFGE
ncbi:MAG: DUF3048 domain-containing protein [Firmicutes bacterium]|nr:DUF3048 domain-containing protein [Bacillota bacterium]